MTLRTCLALFLLALPQPAATATLSPDMVSPGFSGVGVPTTAWDTTVVASPQLRSAEVRSIELEDYDRWRSVVETGLSPDGSWATHAYRQRDTDATLTVQNLESGATHEVERGSSATFSDDSRFLHFTLAAPADDSSRSDPTREAALLNLDSGERWSWTGVASLAFSPGGSHLAVHKRQGERDADHSGAPLILRDLAGGEEELLGHVDQFAFNEAGTHLAYTVSAPDRQGNGLVLVRLSDGARQVLDNAREDYRRLTWDEDEDHGGRLAVLRGLEVEGMVEEANTLLAWADPTGGATEPRTLAPDDVGEGRVISERSTLTWSRDGSLLYFGLRDQRPEPPEFDDDERADVDIWHWADDRIQSAQMVQANRDRNRTDTGVLHLSEGRFVEISDSTLTAVRISPDGRRVVAEDNRAWVHDWHPQYSDLYSVDPASGERSLFLERQLRTLGFSPDGAHFLYWKDDHVWAYVLASDQHVNLTEATPISFVNEEFDRLGEKPPHGVAGWVANGRGVLLESRHDLWLVPLDGGEGRSITGEQGAESEIRYRYLQLDPDEEWIDLDEPIYLTSFGEDDKRAGFARLDGDRLEPLVHEDRWFGRLARAEHSDRVLFTQESFRESTDLWTATLGADLADREQLTDANPHQDEFLWGDRILFEFVTVRGDTLQGTLAIPDDHVPGERRPMLVNYYEQNSHNLNRYPGVSWAHRPQFARYLSHGYMVMQPDVAFHTGDTHSQMLDAVVAATEKVIEMGYADPDRIGLQGHSFSGQGSAHISTQTDRFAAILAGAAATNLVADFNQLWKSAGTNQHRYDTYGQGRFATNPYDDLELYISQSAVHHAASMDTPLLILHGTDDGSVEWLQAVEFYNALRFHEKPVILLSYPGEGHGLREWANQRDFQIRMNQFFDHHLAEAPAPDWMLHGVPHLDKPYHVLEGAPPSASGTDAAVADDADNRGRR